MVAAIQGALTQDFREIPMRTNAPFWRPGG